MVALMKNPTWIPTARKNCHGTVNGILAIEQKLTYHSLTALILVSSRTQASPEFFVLIFFALAFGDIEF